MRTPARVPRTLVLGALVVLCLAIRPVASAPTAPPPPPARAALGTFVRGPQHFVAGTPAALRIFTHWAKSETDSGPWPGVAVEVSLRGAGGRDRLVFRGRTDAAGLADARFTVPDWPDGTYTVEILSHAGNRHERHTQEVAIAPSAKVLLESDKPLYQPAQTIHLRAIALRPQDGKPLAARVVTFTVADPRGNRVFQEKRTLSEFGVAAADFALADEITLGGYQARAVLDGDTGGAAGELTLPVSRYVLPKFKVELETDRAWYAPGDAVKITATARYFFGKPVAGAIAIKTPIATLRGKLDAEGRARLTLDLPRARFAADEALRLDAEVTDSAEQRVTQTRDVQVAVHPIHAELTTEAAELVPGVENQVYVAAAFPDGAPAKDTEVQVRADGDVQRAKTDAIGVARFTVTPQPKRGGRCGANRVELGVGLAQVAGGEVAWTDECRQVARAGGLLVRADRAIYASGAPMTIDLFGRGADGTAYVDVVKDGQTVDTLALAMRAGHGRATLAADERRFGTLVLYAYRVAPDGARTTDSRLVYVERPSALRVEARAERDTFRPGEPGRIRVHVTDAHSGAPARAQVGVILVDQALLALRAMKPGAARTYFTLAAEASRPSLRMKARPGGYTVEKLVDDGALDDLKQEAARILLAGAAPPWAGGFEIDPWALRATARDAQRDRLSQAATKWVETHPAGERAGGKKWRFRHDLLAAMVESGTLAAHELRDPWGRGVPSRDILEAAGLTDFESWAQEQVNARLTAIYRALAAENVMKSAPRDAQITKRRAIVLTAADLERLAATGRIARGRLVDPWGQPFRVEERKHDRAIAGVRSRFFVASAGPDGQPGNADDLYPLDETWYGNDPATIRLADVQVRGAMVGEAFGHGGLGLRGVGMGGGGFGTGSGYGVGYGRLGTVGHGAGTGGEVRVRTEFPETMLWRPDLVTDARGDAIVDTTMADSITTWQLFADAIAADGRMGRTQAEVRVFQDFFVDLDLPPAVTQHDELSVPVAVYNYLPTAQRVTLELDDAKWFERSGERTLSIDLKPSEVGVRHFRVRVLGVGRQKLLVRARGAAASDAIEKPVEIAPDGAERAVSFQDAMGRPGAARHEFHVPDDAIADASIATLKIYPAMATHVVEGLDSLLRMPGGCFEQTSSTTYPNALILDYLRKHKKATGPIETKAKEYLALGYQRLLSFEVRGGGFSWFGQAPDNKILTAYGLEEFHDMARVFPVDERVIARTREWLVAQQREDGSWAPDTYFINEGATNHFNKDVVRITAYIAVALAHTGGGGAALEKARAFVRKNVMQTPPRDAYTLALVTELFGAGDSGGVLDAVIEQLWSERKEDGKLVSFSPREKTPTYGDGKSGTVETTALAAYAMLQTPGGGAGRADRAVQYLLGAKDTFGNWYSTQATILSLKALLAYAGRAAAGKGTVVVRVDGGEVARVAVDAKDELLQAVDLPAAARHGKHDIEVRWEGAGQVAYQLIGRWYEPRAGEPPIDKTAELRARVSLAEARVKPGDVVVEHVDATARVGAVVDMPIVTAGLPPGFDVDQAELDELVRKRVVEKVQRGPRELVFYLARLDGEHELHVALHLRARFPEKVQVPGATAYEYYKPENRVTSAPVSITVDG
jgi:A-macroglobulin TED domain/Alpha-2-macroglobulin family/MG2 domain/A-macroglobulin receptor binding domain/Macroglobulin domain MG3